MEIWLFTTKWVKAKGLSGSYVRKFGVDKENDLLQELEGLRAVWMVDLRRNLNSAVEAGEGQRRFEEVQCEPISVDRKETVDVQPARS